MPVPHRIPESSSRCSNGNTQSPRWQADGATCVAHAWSAGATGRTGGGDSARLPDGFSTKAVFALTAKTSRVFDVRAAVVPLVLTDVRTERSVRSFLRSKRASFCH